MNTKLSPHDHAHPWCRNGSGCVAVRIDGSKRQADLWETLKHILVSWHWPTVAHSQHPSSIIVGHHSLKSRPAYFLCRYSQLIASQSEIFLFLFLPLNRDSW